MLRVLAPVALRYSYINFTSKVGDNIWGWLRGMEKRRDLGQHHDRPWGTSQAMLKGWLLLACHASSNHERRSGATAPPWHPTSIHQALCSLSRSTACRASRITSAPVPGARGQTRVAVAMQRLRCSRWRDGGRPRRAWACRHGRHERHRILSQPILSRC